MKCVKNIKTKEITRVSDRVASMLITNGEAKYTTKGAWKRVGRP